MSNPFLISSPDKFFSFGDEEIAFRRLPPGVAVEFFGGGKTSTSTSSVTIPPEVLARYNAVNAQAQQVAQTPFQQYSTDPNAFVAPLTPTQQAGIENTNATAGEAQPFYGAAAGITGMAGPTNVGQLNGRQINQYMNPFVQSVVNPTAQLLNQQQQAQMSGQTGQAIQQGAFGGDRAGLAAANLAGQQSLAFANAINPLYSQAYNTALSTAQQQQGFNLSQQQANNQLLLQQAGLLGQLGSGAQAAGLQGAQAQLAAGQQEQQTQQAGLSALYNQFLQQQAYPFQTTQFLANIAEGTGALSGSTTTATQPAPFFSDERLKQDVEDIGRTHDGQKIVQFRYKGEDKDTPKRIGLLAQDVEKSHPEAVGLAGGYKTVDYNKALEDAASMGGAVMPEHAGLGFARGGYAYGGDPTDLGMMESQLLAAHQQMYGPGLGGLYGGQLGGTPGKAGYVPQANLPVGRLAVAAPPKQSGQTGFGQAISTAGQLENLYKTGKSIKQDFGGSSSAPATQSPSAPMNINSIAANQQQQQDENWTRSGNDTNQAGLGLSNAADTPPPPVDADGHAQGGLIAHHRDSGGSVDDNPSDEEGMYKTSGPKLAIPEVNPNAKLATASAPGGGGGSALGAISGLASAASTIGNGIGDIAALFAAFKDGGLVPREHHADGDSVGDDSNNVYWLKENARQADQSTGLNPDAPVPDQQPDRPDGLNPDLPAPGAHEASTAAPSQEKTEPDWHNYEHTPTGRAQYIKDYMSYRGADPTHALGVAGAEGLYAWGKNNPNAASKVDIDEKGNPYSFGDFQLNIKNGLGVSALKAGIDPRDPTQWGAADKYAMDYMIENGLGPWKNNAYVKGLSANTPTRMAQADRGTMTDAAPSGGVAGGVAGGNSPGVGGWFDRNENWIIPLLSGIGTMASSPSRYFGAALLQGLGGGAQAYANLQQQQAQYGLPGQMSIPQQRVNVEAQRNALETAKYLTTSMVRHQDPVTGEVFWVGPNGRMSDAEHSALMNQTGQVLGGANPTVSRALTGPAAAASPGNAPANAPAKTSSAPAAANVPAAATPAVSKTQPNAPSESVFANIDDSSIASDRERPSWLIARNNLLQKSKQNMQSQGLDTAPIETEIAANENMLKSITSGENTPLMKNNQPFMDYRNVANQRNAQTETVKNMASANLEAWKSARADAETANDMRTQTQLLLDTAFDQNGRPTVSSGPLGQQINYLTGIAKQIGAPESIQRQISSASNAQEIEKLTIQLGTMFGRQALGSGNRETQAEFMQFLKTVPGLSLSPDAIKSIAQQAILPKANQSLGTWSAIKDLDPAKDNIQKVITDYKIEHPWYTARPQGAANITPEQARAELERRRAAKNPGAP